MNKKDIKKNAWIGRTKEERKALAKKFHLFGRIALAIGFLFLVLPAVLSSKWVSPKQYLLKNSKNWYHNDTDICIERFYYESPDTIITRQSSTTDGYHIDEEKLRKLHITDQFLIADENNQSQYFVSGNTAHGTLVKGGQIYGILEDVDTSMAGCFIVKDPETILENYQATPTDDLLSFINGIDSRNITYEGTIDVDNGKISVFYLKSPGKDMYLYYSSDKKSLCRTIQISSNALQVTDIITLDKNITFFEEMESFPSFSLIDAEEYHSMFKNFSIYALTKSEALLKKP